MNQGELKRRIQYAAQAQKKDWRLIRQGARHELWQCGDTKVTIPRHREINEFTARGIFRDIEEELGRGWWRK